MVTVHAHADGEGFIVMLSCTFYHCLSGCYGMCVHTVMHPHTIHR